MLKFRKKVTRYSAVAVTVVSVLALAGPANADTAQVVRNHVSDGCLAVPNASTANGTGVIQWTCNPLSFDRMWDVDWVSGGNGDRYTFKNHNSGKCLAMPNASTANGTQAIQWTCNGSSEQQWIVDSIGRIRNVNSDKCLADPNSSTTNGTEVVQWTCTTNSDQLWTLYNG